MGDDGSLSDIRTATRHPSPEPAVVDCSPANSTALHKPSKSLENRENRGVEDSFG